MTPDMVTELIRNLYNASGGYVPPTAFATALTTMMWNERWQKGWTNAFASAEAARNSGASDEEVHDAFHDAFADALGWTRGDFDRFMKDNLLTRENASRYQEGVDLWEWMASGGNR